MLNYLLEALDESFFLVGVFSLELTLTAAAAFIVVLPNPDGFEEIDPKGLLPIPRGLNFPFY